MKFNRFVLLVLASGPLGLVLVLSVSSLVYFLVDNFFTANIYSIRFSTFLGILLWGGLSMLSFLGIYSIYVWAIKKPALIEEES